jgi:hypothetical protein
MKAIGLGSPDELRVHLAACEIDVLVDVLREQRAGATRDAAQTYATTSPGHTRAIDDRHERLRAIEALLVQLDDQPQTDAGAIIVGDTQLMCDVVRDGAREALRRLKTTYERYEEHASPQSRDTLLDAVATVTAWVATLAAVDRVDRGWDA